MNGGGGFWRAIWNFFKSLFTIDDLDEEEEDDDYDEKPSKLKPTEVRKGRKLLSIEDEDDSDEKSVLLDTNPVGRSLLSSNKDVVIGTKNTKIVQKIVVPASKIKKDDLKVEIVVNGKPAANKPIPPPKLINDGEESSDDDSDLDEKKPKKENKKESKSKTVEKKSSGTVDSIAPAPKVGWEHRYRVSRMKEDLEATAAENHDDVDEKKKSPSKTTTKTDKKSNNNKKKSKDSKDASGGHNSATGRDDLDF